MSSEVHPHHFHVSNTGHSSHTLRDSSPLADLSEVEEVPVQLTRSVLSSPPTADHIPSTRSRRRSSLKSGSGASRSQSKYSTRTRARNHSQSPISAIRERRLSAPAAQPSRRLRSQGRNQKPPQLLPAKGDIIRVLWPIDETYYEAQVASILNYRGKKFFDVLYDSGEEEFYLDLSVRKWRFADGRDGKIHDEIPEDTAQHFDWSNYPRVGDRIFVQWHVDLDFYPGVVRDIMTVENRLFYDVDYEGGDREFFLDLNIRNWTFPDPNHPSRPSKRSISREKAYRSKNRRVSAPANSHPLLNTSVRNSDSSAHTSCLKRRKPSNQTFPSALDGDNPLVTSTNMGSPDGQIVLAEKRRKGRPSRVPAKSNSTGEEYDNDYMDYDYEHDADQAGDASLSVLNSSGGNNAFRVTQTYSPGLHRDFGQSTLDPSASRMQRDYVPSNVAASREGSPHVYGPRQTAGSTSVVPKAPNQFQWRRASNIAAGPEGDYSFVPFNFQSSSSVESSPFIPVSRMSQMGVKDIIAISGKAAQKWMREKTSKLTEGLDSLEETLSGLKVAYSGLNQVAQERKQADEKKLAASKARLADASNTSDPACVSSREADQQLSAIRAKIMADLHNFRGSVEDMEKTHKRELNLLKSTLSKQNESLVKIGETLDGLEVKGLEALMNLDPAVREKLHHLWPAVEKDNITDDSELLLAPVSVRSREQASSSVDGGVSVIQTLKHKLNEVMENRDDMERDLKRLQARENELLRQKRETMKQLTTLRSERDSALAADKSKQPSKRGPGRPPTRQSTSKVANVESLSKRQVPKPTGITKRRSSQRRESSVVTRSTGRANRKSLPPNSSRHTPPTEVFLVDPNELDDPTVQNSVLQLTRQMDRQASELLATISSVWLLQDESRSEPPKVAGWHQESWVRRCVLNCLKHASNYLENVNSVMSAKRNLREDVDGENVVTDWLLSDDDADFEKARSNYGMWEPALEDIEWGVEKRVLRGLSCCYKKAFAAISATSFSAIITYAKAIALKSVMDFEVFFPAQFAPLLPSNTGISSPAPGNLSVSAPSSDNPAVSTPTGHHAAPVVDNLERHDRSHPLTSENSLNTNDGNATSSAIQAVGVTNSEPDSNGNALIQKSHNDGPVSERAGSLSVARDPDALQTSAPQQSDMNSTETAFNAGLSKDIPNFHSDGTPTSAANNSSNGPGSNPNQASYTVNNASGAFSILQASNTRPTSLIPSNSLYLVTPENPSSVATPVFPSASTGSQFPDLSRKVTADIAPPAPSSAYTATTPDIGNGPPDNTDKVVPDMTTQHKNLTLEPSFQAPALTENTHTLMATDSAPSKIMTSEPSAANPTLPEHGSQTTAAPDATGLNTKTLPSPNQGLDLQTGAPRVEIGSHGIPVANATFPKTTGAFAPAAPNVMLPPWGSVSAGAGVKEFVSPVSKDGAERLRKMTEGVNVPALNVPSPPGSPSRQTNQIADTSGKGARSTRGRGRPRGRPKGRSTGSTGRGAAGVKKSGEGRGRGRSTTNSIPSSAVIIAPALPVSSGPICNVGRIDIPPGSLSTEKAATPAITLPIETVQSVPVKPIQPPSAAVSVAIPVGDGNVQEVPDASGFGDKQPTLAVAAENAPIMTFSTDAFAPGVSTIVTGAGGESGEATQLVNAPRIEGGVIGSSLSPSDKNNQPDSVRDDPEQSGVVSTLGGGTTSNTNVSEEHASIPPTQNAEIVHGDSVAALDGSVHIGSNSGDKPEHKEGGLQSVEDLLGPATLSQSPRIEGLGVDISTGDATVTGLKLENGNGTNVTEKVSINMPISSDNQEGSMPVAGGTDNISAQATAVVVPEMSANQSGSVVGETTGNERSIMEIVNTALDPSNDNGASSNV